MKSVLLISNFLFHHGIGSKTVCEELAEKLRESGLSVISASSKMKRFPRILDMLQTVWTRRYEYDVAHVAVFSGPAFVWAEATCAALQFLRKPYALTLHGGNLPDFAQDHPSRVRKLLRSANAVLAPSHFLRHRMEQYVGTIHLMQNALDLERYPYHKRVVTSPSLVWLRAFDEIYNPMLAPRVLRLISDEFPDAHLTMVGPDKGDGSLERTQNVARELGVESRICFAGRVPKQDIPNWLIRGDVFLNTTNVDNSPVSVLEAMACGLCIVTTNVGGIPYLLADGKEALFVAPDEPQSMADQVKRVLKNSGLAETLSLNARKKVEEHDWSVVLPKWQALFARLADTSK